MASRVDHKETLQEVLEGIQTGIICQKDKDELRFDQLYAQYDRLSTGEQTLLDVALQLWNGGQGGGRATVHNILLLDHENCRRVLRAMERARFG